MSMENEILKIRKARGSVKSRLTVFTKFIDKIASLKTDVPIIEIKTRISRAENILSDFENMQGQLELLLDEVTEEEINYRSEFEDLFYKTVSKAHTYLSNVSSPSSTESCATKLPRIDLRKFSGNFETWLDFRDSFESLIVQNPSINCIQKFHYLKSCVTGNAERVINSLTVSASNFTVAWKLLCDRYANKELLLHNHIKSIFNLIPLTKESSTGIRRLVDNLSSNLRSLETLGQPVEHWDSLLIYLILEKIDSDTAKDWEKGKPQNASFAELLSFLENKAAILEKLEISQRSNKHLPSKASSSSAPKSRSSNSHSLVNQEFSANFCRFCNGEHKIIHCEGFLKLDVHSRIEQIKKLSLCFNCLYNGHKNTNCQYGKCRRCGKKHHTLLHIDTLETRTVQTSNSTPNPQTSLSSCSQDNIVFLSTVKIRVRDKCGVLHVCRGLLDSGSQSNFITASLCDNLGLTKSHTNISVTGITQVTTDINVTSRVQIQSLCSSFAANLSCLVVSSICDRIPSYHFDISAWNIPPNIRLSDPEFNVPSKIDILIGASLFWDLLHVGQVKLGHQKPVLQKTKLGWVISGPMPTRSCNPFSSNATSMKASVDLTRFWEIEEFPSREKLLSQEEEECEAHFRTTYQREENGRFVVFLPLRDTPTKLGDSRLTATKRFHNLERRLQSNNLLKERYVHFMEEYATMGHMTKCSFDDSVEPEFYLPHHGVLKEENVTTKLRVVFDGSFRSSSGISINDLQMVGPTIQSDLNAILLRFRQHAVVVSADIEKMYRQVLVHPSQRNLQKLVWRSDPVHPLSFYQLNTITYGTASASFLAIRCIHQLSLDFAEQFTEASKTISRDFYVDDLLTGSDSITALSRICSEIRYILDTGCFPIHKWVSNEPKVLDNIHTSVHSTTGMLLLGSNENTKTLGLQWHPQRDSLSYQAESASLPKSITKRSILAGVSQIFDPLGLLSAAIIKVKMLLQQLWLEKLGWDQSVPLDIHTQWLLFCNQLKCLNELSIPRHVILKDSIIVELHGFCDASESAYGAAIYIKSVDRDGNVAVNLLCAKTKVAPLKKISIPRLELCGALILARLVEKVIASFTIQFNNSYFWTDSTVVLGWINTSPHLLKTFVANRIAKIQSKTSANKWRHVGTRDNPADLLSRGVELSFLKSSDLWWHGPQFLLDQSCIWPSSNSQASNELPELRTVYQSMAVVNSNSFPFDRFSNYTTLKRVTAYCLRLTYNSLVRDKSLRSLGPITTQELQNSINSLVKIIQRENFPLEYEKLSQGKSIPNTSKILSLNPFLDNFGLIRVGGRLCNSNFHFDKRHPILLPSRHHFTKLLFRSEHLRLLHAGPQHLLSVIREKFWPIYGRSLAKIIVHECVQCFRAKPNETFPIMGNIPSVRFTTSFPFSATGVDYAGPVMLKSSPRRGSPCYKSYISLFVCLSTRAIHLELVTDLTTQSFMLALKRFIIRRGKPARIISDNGTNFLGSKNELKELGNFLRKNEAEIGDMCTKIEINWQFIPAHAPHFGGIWEAGVKCMKSHLKRVLGDTKLTYEHLSTVLIQIEGILNSRPLTFMSSDPSDLSPLTPSHFLIGRTMDSIPELDVSKLKPNHLSAFQRLQQLRQHFWQRWSLEYISELQSRQKWKQNQFNIQVGTIVLIKDRTMPPLNWLMGRVELLHPGVDGVTRVVTLRTTKGLMRRAVATLCPLPINEEQ